MSHHYNYTKKIDKTPKEAKCIMCGIWESNPHVILTELCYGDLICLECLREMENEMD